MKKLTTIIMTLSLFAGSALFAQNNFASFYPAEDNDSPDYLVTDETSSSSSEYFLSLDTNDEVHKTTSSTSRMIKKDHTFDAFYPVEDVD